MMRAMVTGLALLLSTAGLSAQEGRTLVERLSLDTPESAVGAFIEAFGREDYFAAYYMLSPEAKKAFAEGYYTYNLGRLIVTGDTSFVPGSVFSADELPEAMLTDLSYDLALIFDNIVHNATTNGQMPFSLAEARIMSTSEVSDEAVVVAVDAPEVSSRMRFETILAYDDQWRIDRIAWDGSDPEERPWGISEDKGKAKP